MSIYNSNNNNSIGLNLLDSEATGAVICESNQYPMHTSLFVVLREFPEGPLMNSLAHKANIPIYIHIPGRSYFVDVIWKYGPLPARKYIKNGCCSQLRSYFWNDGSGFLIIFDKIHDTDIKLKRSI